jgi:hypothetical protein
MTRQEIERLLNELACEHVETHDQKIIEELYKLTLELGRMLKRVIGLEARSCAVVKPGKVMRVPDLPDLHS